MLKTKIVVVVALISPICVHAATMTRCPEFFSKLGLLSLRQSDPSIDRLPLEQQRRIRADLGGSGSIRILSFENYGEIRFPGLRRNGNSWFFSHQFGDQVIQPSNPIERDLITRSFVGTIPREVLTIRANRNGEMVSFDDFCTGGTCDISHETLRQALDSFIDKFMSRYPD
jgi:hypothetical protein